MLGFLMFATFVIGSVQLVNEYKYLLEFKKEERLFDEYKKKMLMNLMIFLLILMPISFDAARVEAAPDVSTEDTGTEITTEEEKNFPDDYKVVTFATPTDGVGTPTDQLDIQLLDVYKVLVAILACVVCMIAWGVFRTVYRILTSQKI